MKCHDDFLASRMQQIRVEMFGDEGFGILSGALNIPARTWENFEKGVLIPGWTLLQFIELTGVEPQWLLTGNGERYRISPAKPRRSGSR